MPVLTAPTAPTHTLDGTSFTSLATPTRGATANVSLWRVVIAPGTAPTPHSLTREEVFVVLHGVAEVTLDGESTAVSVGDTIVVPPDRRFSLGNAGDEPVELLCCLPVGGQARLEDGTLLTPPWAR